MQEFASSVCYRCKKECSPFGAEVEMSYDPEFGNQSSTKCADCVKITTQKINEKKVGRNDPCPCGSGWKHKKCCLDQ